MQVIRGVDRATRAPCALALAAGRDAVGEACFCRRNACNRACIYCPLHRIALRRSWSSPVAMAILNFLLRSLKYPRLECFNADDPAHFQAAVVWLENTKVRQYPIDGRAALQSPDPAVWQAALTKYLADLECPLRLEAGNHRAVLQWLASHAGALGRRGFVWQCGALKLLVGRCRGSYVLSCHA